MGTAIELLEREIERLKQVCKDNYKIGYEEGHRDGRKINLIIYASDKPYWNNDEDIHDTNLYHVSTEARNEIITSINNQIERHVAPEVRAFREGKEAYREFLRNESQARLKEFRIES